MVPIQKSKGLIGVIAIVVAIVIFGPMLQPASIVTIEVEHHVTKTNTSGNDYYYTTLKVKPLISQPEEDSHLTNEILQLSTSVGTSDSGLPPGFVYPTGWVIHDIVIARAITILGGVRDGELIHNSIDYHLSDTLTLQNQGIKSSYEVVDLSDFDLDETTPALQISTSLRYDADSNEVDSSIDNRYIQHSFLRFTITPYEVYEQPGENETGTGSYGGQATTNGGNFLSGVTVTIGEQTDITDSNGWWLITDIPAGSYTITGVKSGYQTFSYGVTITDTTEGQISVYMPIIDTPPVTHETDTDNDGMDDDWEIQYFGNLDQPANLDYDDDGLTNIMEYEGGTDPTVPEGGVETEYEWTDYGYMAALGGIILAAVVFAVVPTPPKIKGFIAIAAALGGFVIAHLLNTGVI